MELFIIITILFVISSVFSYINGRWIKLPGVIGVMFLAICTSILTMVAGKTLPLFSHLILGLSKEIDF
jgi:CPA1 family monovalent cation:H+ antiporter